MRPAVKPLAKIMNSAPSAAVASQCERAPQQVGKATLTRRRYGTHATNSHVVVRACQFGTFGDYGA